MAPRVAVIGCGQIADAHVQQARRAGATVAAVCDRSPHLAEQAAARHGVPAWYTDLDALLEELRPDVVHVTTPPASHLAIATRALAAGAHVLVERPVALTVEGVARALKAAERHRRTLLVAMNFRFRSDVQAVQGFLAGGELGEVSAIRAGWTVFRAVRQQLGWRSRRPESGGGAMVDLGLPMVDLAMWLASGPEIVRVSAHLTRGQGAGAVDEAGAAFLQTRCWRSPTVPGRSL